MILLSGVKENGEIKKKKKETQQPTGVLQGQETETYRKLLDHTPSREEKVLMRPALKLSYIMLMILPIISVEENNSIDEYHVLMESSFLLKRQSLQKER